MKIEKVLCTGAAGFIGSHLAEHYLKQGCSVVGVDNLVTGNENNVNYLLKNYGDKFIFIKDDISNTHVHPNGFDLILHFASPASPNIDFEGSYFNNPEMTIKANVHATMYLVEHLAPDARLVFASTSEIYGDPKVTPQYESYTGNVDPYSKRSVYDEAKRMGETICSMGRWHLGKDTKVVRIFNTYGERIPDDGRVISNFITQALRGEKITVFGGKQTRSFLYVSDLVDGIVRVAESEHGFPVNIGSTEEITILELAQIIAHKTGVKVKIQSNTNRAVDDPQRRCADTTKIGWFGWKETVSLSDGLDKTIEWFRRNNNG